MNRTRSFLYNTVTSAVTQVAILLTGIIIPRILLGAYGSEVNGLISSVSQFIAYFKLVEAGLSAAAVYALYKPLADNDHKSINGILTGTKKLYIQSGFIYTFLLIILSVTYPIYIRSEVAPSLDISLIILILGVNFALEFFTLSKYRVLLMADQKSYVISIAFTIETILSTMIIAGLAVFRVHIVILRAAALSAVFIRTAIILRYCKARYKFLDYSVPPDSGALSKRWDALYQQILSAVHTSTPVVLITLLLKDLKLVSVFSVFNMVIAGIGGVLGIFINGLSASFGDIVARNERSTLQAAYREFEFTYYCIISFVYAVTLATIMPFIRLYTAGVSDINYNQPLIGILLVLNGLFYNIKTPQGMLVVSAGFYKETKRQTTIQGLIAVVLGAALTPSLGIAGIAIGSIVSNIYRDIDLLIFVPRRITKLPVRQSVFRIIRLFACVLIMTIPFLFIKSAPSDFGQWVLFATQISFCTFAVILITALIFDRKEVLNVRNRLRNLVGSKIMKTQVQKKEDCCGCTACQSVCPREAITMQADDKGFLYPRIDKTLCNGCGLCKKVCPLGTNRDTAPNTVRLREPLVFAAKHKNDSIRLSSSSGGVFTALSDLILENRGVVYGACFDSAFKVYHNRASTKTARDHFKGSKYVQSDLSTIFSDVLKDLQDSKPVLFSGTPCQVAGLKSFLKCNNIGQHRLYTCDLVCHGVTSPVIWREYLFFMEKEFKGRPTAVCFRSKDFPNNESGMKITFRNDAKCRDVQYKGASSTDRYFRLYYSRLTIRESCNHCQFTNLCRPADITVGDFWGIENYMPEFDDGNGVSLVLVNSEKGSSLFTQVSSKLELRESNLTECLPGQPQLQQPCKADPRTERFWNDYHKKGFRYVINKYAPDGKLYRMKTFILGFVQRIRKRGLAGIVKKLLGYDR